MIYAQIAILCLLTARFFTLLYSAFHGQKAKEPAGYAEAVLLILVMAGLVWLYWKAGAFSLLW